MALLARNPLVHAGWAPQQDHLRRERCDGRGSVRSPRHARFEVGLDAGAAAAVAASDGKHPRHLRGTAAAGPAAGDQTLSRGVRSTVQPAAQACRQYSTGAVPGNVNQVCHLYQRGQQGAEQPAAWPCHAMACALLTRSSQHPVCCKPACYQPHLAGCDCRLSRRFLEAAGPTQRRNKLLVEQECRDLSPCEGRIR